MRGIAPLLASFCAWCWCSHRPCRYQPTLLVSGTRPFPIRRKGSSSILTAAAHWFVPLPFGLGRGFLGIPKNRRVSPCKGQPMTSSGPWTWTFWTFSCSAEPQWCYDTQPLFQGTLPEWRRSVCEDLTALVQELSEEQESWLLCAPAHVRRVYNRGQETTQLHRVAPPGFDLAFALATISRSTTISH